MYKNHRRIKYWAINLTKDMKDLYIENYYIDERTQIRHKWMRAILCSWIGQKIILLICLYYPKQSKDSV